MCAALPWEAKVAFWKINKAFGSQLLTREKVKNFLKNSSGSWQGFQRRFWRLQDASPTPYIFLPILAFFLFFFFIVSHHPTTLASFYPFFFGVLASQNEVCLSFELPCHPIFFLFSFIRISALCLVERHKLGMQLGLSAPLCNFLKSVQWTQIMSAPPSCGDGNHAFHGGKVPSCCRWFCLKCQSSLMWSEHAIPRDSGIGLRQWRRANQSASGGPYGRQAGRTMGSYGWGWSNTQQRSQRQGTDGAPGSRKKADHSLSPTPPPQNPVLFHHMSHCGFPPLN